MEDICQSCSRAPVEIIDESNSTANPIRICKNCQRRLRFHTLRPREWYNLIATHGHVDILGEEYYNQNDGTALNPGEAVINADSFPCPTLEEEKGSADRLLTYILSRNHWHDDGILEWYIHDHLISAIRLFPQDELLSVFTDRLKSIKSLELTGTIFRLIGLTLGETGAPLVREYWDRFEFTGIFKDTAFAASKCLPLKEAHQRVTDALSKMDDKRRAAASYALLNFKTELNLDWIEKNATSPVWSGWGEFAASSRFDWERARKWLSAGRPMSLIALDALHWCLCSDRMPPLINPPSVEEFVTTLQDYLNRDNVPRTREIVLDFLKHARYYLSLK